MLKQDIIDKRAVSGDRRMDVRDIVGDVKKDRFGHRLYSDPQHTGKFAGGAGRQGAVD